MEYFALFGVNWKVTSPWLVSGSLAMRDYFITFEDLAAGTGPVASDSLPAAMRMIIAGTPNEVLLGRDQTIVLGPDLIGPGGTHEGESAIDICTATVEITSGAEFFRNEFDPIPVPGVGHFANYGWFRFLIAGDAQPMQPIHSNKARFDVPFGTADGYEVWLVKKVSALVTGYRSPTPLGWTIDPTLRTITAS